MYRRARYHRGFTLIELLVVIAIISILASILFPVFARARAKGRQTACISNQYQVCLALNMYSQDADEVFPPGTDWYQSVYGYMRNRDILFCPDRKDKAPGYGMNYAASGLSIGSFWDPAKKVLIGDVRPEVLGITNPGYMHSPPEWWINRPGAPPAGGDNSWKGNNIPERHNDGTVYGYADGHVKWSREMAIDDDLHWNPAVATP